MWGAMLSLLEGGFLKIPDDVTIVWADDGTGIIKGSQNAKAGQVQCLLPLSCVTAMLTLQFIDGTGLVLPCHDDG